jgi:hypothetical protein
VERQNIAVIAFTGVITSPTRHCIGLIVNCRHINAINIHYSAGRLRSRWEIPGWTIDSKSSHLTIRRCLDLRLTEDTIDSNGRNVAVTKTGGEQSRNYETTHQSHGCLQ